jgi:DNA-directed RNA polymerase subunit N (RpoN/RPB10)
MLIPIRCFTCGKLIAHKWEEYKKLLNQNKTPKEILDYFNFKRYCCRRMFLTHVDIIDHLLMH